MQPLRELTKSSTPWTWQEEQKQAFRNIKEALSDATTLVFFDLHKMTMITVDAGPKGL